MKHENAPGIAGEVSEDEFWERIDYFLERVVPVAEENKVRLACHPHDPYTPPGFRGVTRVLGSPDGLKKFVHMHESPYHGLNFCQGTVTEMLDDPGEEIFDIIRYFGSRERSSTSTSATSAVTNSTSWRCSPTRAASICSSASRSTKRSATSTC